MAVTTAVRQIEAPINAVFDAVANIQNFAAIVPDIIDVEFLSESKVGVGTRFRETRMMGKRKAQTVLEVSEYVPGERVRMISDQGGTIWDTVFTTRDLGAGNVELKLVMDARAYKLAAKMFNPLIKGMIRKAIEKDMDCVKSHCEST